MKIRPRSKKKSTRSIDTLIVIMLFLASLLSINEKKEVSGGIITGITTKIKSFDFDAVSYPQADFSFLKTVEQPFILLFK
jgi:hypothetical protein